MQLIHYSAYIVINGVQIKMYLANMCIIKNCTQV